MANPYRQSETDPIGARILDALEKKAQDLKVANGYFYDYAHAQLVDMDALTDFHAFKWGNCVLIFDGPDRPEVDETGVQNWVMEGEIHAFVKDNSGTKRSTVIQRVKADITKMWDEFCDAQNGLLTGPARITRREAADHAIGGVVVMCNFEIWQQNTDGDACALS